MGRESGSIRKSTILMLISLLIVSQNLGVFSPGQVAEANPENPVPIEFGETLSGSIGAAGEKDTYVFSANASDVVLARVSATVVLPIGIGLYLNDIKLKGASGWNDAWLSYRLPDDGEYKILVYAQFDFTGGYNIHLQRPNNPANAIPIDFGETLSGSIDAAAEMDTYTFWANASDVVLVRVSGASFQLGIGLYYPNGTKLKGASGWWAAELSSPLPDDGEYKILVYALLSLTGSYKIYLQRLNNPANAVPIEFGDTLSGSIDVVGEVDTYVFPANASDVGLVRVSATLRLIGIGLYCPNGTKLKGASGWSTVEVSSVLPDDGEYQILVYDAQSMTGSYKLSLKSMTPEQLVLDVPFVDSISSGEWRYYKVDTEAGKNLLVSLKPESSTGSLELYGRYGESPTRSKYDFAARKRNVLGNYELLISPTEEGTYYISVYGKDVEDTLSYEITASIVDRHVSDIYPRSVTNSTKVIVHITGLGFTNGMRVELRNASALNISAQSVIVSSSQMIVAHFNLSDASLGQYDISVIWPDDYEETIEGAVEVNELQEGALYSFLFEISKGSTLTYEIEVPQTENLFVTLQKTTLVSYGNSWSGKLSLLYGGEEIASDSGSHDLILHIADPDPGPYNVSITSYRAGEGILTVWTSLLELPLGEWVVGTIYCSYGSVWYQVEVPPDQDALYFEAEAMGLWSHFDIYYGKYGSSEHWVSRQGIRTSIQILDPDAGLYIVQFLDSAMLWGPGGLGAEWLMDQSRDVLIKADTKESVTAPPGYQPFITRLSPDSGGNTGLVTVEINGGWLDPNATVSLVRLDYEDIIAQNVYGSSGGTILTVTFNLIGKEPGEWNLVVANPDGQNATAPSSFIVEEGGEPELWAEIIGREKIRAERGASYFLRYGNSGDVDMPAPLFVIYTSATWPILRVCVSLHRISSWQTISEQETTIKLLGKGSPGSPGILRPGSSYSIPLYVCLLTEWGESGGSFAIHLSAMTADPIFEVPNLVNFQDAFCPTPGTPLQFTRVFPQGSIRSSYLGPLGYGWIHNYDVHLEELGDGTIVLCMGDSYSRFFLSNGDGTYTALGDYGTLTRNHDDTFQLKEVDGTVFGFRTDLRLDFIEDINGNGISAVYDSDDQMIELQHSCGDSFDLEYNECGRISRLVDHIGRVTEYQYDEAGELLLNVTSPDGEVTSYNYTCNGANYGLTVISYPGGIQQFFEYDRDGRLSEVYLNDEEELVQYSYNISSKTTYITDAEANVAAVRVDDFGQIICSENPLGAVTQYEYDDDFNIIRATDPLGNTYDFSYDEQGNIDSITNPLNHKITMGYNLSFNKLTWLRDAKGNEITFDYDEYGNMVEITYADSSTEFMDYDFAGNLISEKSRKGDAISYNYNDRGQLVRKDYPDESWVAYEYDDAGNMIFATDESGIIEMEYNTRDLLTRVTYPTGHFFNYSYDDARRLIQRVDQDGNVLNYEYDDASCLVRISDESDSDIVRYEYDAVGRLSKKSLSNSAYTTYKYDAAGQILHLINYNTSGGVLSRFDCTYDLAGNLISVNKLEGTYGYEYDEIGQLTKVTYPDGHYVSYSYDAAGNRIAVVDDGKTTTYTTNIMNQYTEVGNVSYSYDANANLISKIEDGQATTYQYNFENRLTKVTSPEGTWEYIYDALGNRVGVIHNGIEHRYLVDPIGLGDVAAEYDGEGNLIARYLHGLGLISQIDAQGNHYYYHFDPTGHTMKITGEDGNVVNSYKYSPFGICLEIEENIPNPFGYVGEFGVMDDGNGLNYMRMRCYQPEVGRFLSEDPFMIPGGNRYGYTGNNPIMFIDPIGMSKFKLPYPMSASLAISTAPASVPLWMREELELGGAAPIFGPPFSGTGMPGPWWTILLEPDLITYSCFGWQALYEFAGWKELYKLPAEMTSFALESYMELRKYMGFWNLLSAITSRLIGVVYSTTPEDKYGLTGFDLPDTPYEERKRFVPADQKFYYKVDFWNKENATAPACDVFVKDQLDADLDWSTFRFEEIGFLNWTVDLEPCQYFSVNVDMRPEMDLIVNVEGTFDPETAEIEWVFRSLDPDTMETPEDPMAGFLPPITESGYEIGWVCFSIDPKTGLPTGSQISNQAFVKFDVGDFNPAPKEGPFVNTIDAAPPTSSVTATLNAETIELNWTGNDPNGSGIRDYTIYLSEDGNPYEPWLLHTTNSSGVFVGESNHTYAFYSIARDNVGNIEEAPTEPDVIISADSSSPATLHDYDGLWHTTDFIITLTATDDFSGIAETYYKINYGPTKTVSANGQPYINTESGNNTLEYWSVDNAANEEIPHKILTRIKLDKTAPTANAGQDQTVNVKSTVDLDAGGSTDNLGIVSYEWDFGDETTGTGVTANHTYTNPGTYTVTLSVKDEAGNIDTCSITITVLPTEAFPLWIIGATIAAVIGISVAVAILLRKRKKHRQNTSKTK